MIRLLAFLLAFSFLTSPALAHTLDSFKRAQAERVREELYSFFQKLSFYKLSGFKASKIEEERVRELPLKREEKDPTKDYLKKLLERYGK